MDRNKIKSAGTKPVICEKSSVQNGGGNLPLNKKELSQLYYLNREIEEQQRRLYELESLATSASSCITGMPKVKWTNDKVAQYACEIADLKSLLDLNLKKCFYELNRLNRYIDSVADNEISQILALRYINGLSWEQVAAHISHYATADSVRMMHNRFLSQK